MTYADPTRCPNCAAYAQGAQRCARCGLLLIGPTPQLLLRTLSDADRVLDGLRAEAYGWRRAPAQPYAPVVQRETAQGRRHTSWTVGSTLLTLGALCLVVAAFVFVSVSWGSLGLLGRTVILAAATAAIGGVAVAVTRRRLRASAEALWSVFLAMLVLDFLGAWAYGLLGMGALPADVATLVLGVLLATAAALAAWYAGDRVDLSLVAPEAGACLGLTVALAGLGVTAPFEAFWTALTAVVAALVAAAVFHCAGLRSPSWYAAGLAVLAQFTAISVAIGESFAYGDDLALFMRVGILHTVVAGAITYLLGAGAYAIVRRRGSEDADVIATATTAIAVTPGLALAYAPVNATVAGAQVVAAIVLVALACVGAVARGPWSRGARITAAIAAAPPVGTTIAWLGLTAASLLDMMTPVWTSDGWVRLGSPEANLGPAWVAVVTIGSPAIAIAATGWYADVQQLVRIRVASRWAAIWCAVAGLFVAGCRLSPPVLVVALVAIGVGVVVCGVARRIEPQLAGLGLLVAASALPVSSPTASVVAWSVAVACATGIAAVVRQRIVRALATTIAVAYLHLTVVGAADLADADMTVMHLTLVACVVSVGLGAQFFRVAEVRLAAEVVAGAFGLAAVALATSLSLEWQSAILTTLGVVCGFIALIRSDRRGLAAVGGVLTGLAYLLRLVASDVGVVEAYTLPFGVILLAAGYRAMRRSQQMRTAKALLPGLLVALAPSLPAVLIDPTSLRGLLLGLASLGVLGIGAWLRWQAPFLVGATLVVMIAVRHIGPYADAVPRWSLIATAGAVMVAVGITWESRVRDARSLAGHVGSMR